MFYCLLFNCYSRANIKSSFDTNVMDKLETPLNIANELTVQWHTASKGSITTSQFQLKLTFTTVMKVGFIFIALV